MITKIKEWIDERWPLSSLVRLSLEEEIPGGARFVHALGSAALILFMLQMLTGIMQLFFYVPATDHAYDSISYLRTRVPFGWLIHGLHYWGAQLMVIVVLLHMTRVFLWGAYKKPRELTWLAGLTLFLITMGFSFTGSPLLWDQRGYWIGEVSTSVPGTAPLLGDFIKRFMRGGEEMGQLALSRLFTLHTAVLPLTLMALFGIHITAMRRFGSAGPWKEEEREPKGPFWPDQVFKDAIAGTTIFFFLLFLTVFLPPGYSGLADPLDVSFIPKPDWNFLFLYESLKYFQGPLEPVGTVGVPTLLLLILVLLPFVDRNPERNPLKRPIAMICALILAALVVGLSIKGYLSPGFAQPPVKPKAASSQSGSSSAPGISSTLFAGVSEAAIPVRDNKPVSGRPATGAETASPSDAKKGLPGRSAYSIGSAERGAEVFRKNCSACHGPEGKTNVPNPGSDEGKVPDLNPVDREHYNADAQIFAENIDIYIQHGAVPEGPNPAIRMPVFGDTNTLTQQEIANVEAYILLLNGVDRAQLVNPGMQPRNFFLLIVILYVLILLVLGGLWNKRSRQVS
jgi:ubiquinol-cytochrome c reductase cytochrome b subunit